MNYLKYCCVVIIDKTQDKTKTLYLFCGYGKPDGAGADAKGIAEHWEKICQDFNMPTEIDVVANDFLHRITTCYDRIDNRGWIFDSAYSYRAEFDARADYIYVLTLNKEKNPRYVDFDAYQIPERLTRLRDEERIRKGGFFAPPAEIKRADYNWEDICTEENRVEVPNESKRQTERIWSNPNLKYKPKDE